MESYLVTGGMGFIGSHWCEHLLKQGKTVYAIDLAPRHRRLLDYDRFIFVHDTIKNYDILKTLVDRVDCVCHFAGIAEPQQYVDYPRKVIDVTAVAGINLIEMCRLKGKLFFLTSTSEVYGKNGRPPFKEEDDRVLGATFTRRWCYSTAKALLEHYLDACAASRELDHVIVRLFNIFGPRLKGRVVPNFMNKLIAGEDLIIHGDGSQTRSFTYVDDAIEAFDSLVHTEKCKNQVFNVGNPVETSINELAETMMEVGGFKSKIEYRPHKACYGESYEDIERRVPDISKIRKFVGWEPKTSLADGIRETLEYERRELCN